MVTGASRGIGRAVAEALAAQGIDVFGTSRKPEAVVWPDGVRGVFFDASSPAAVQASWDVGDFARLRFDIVVNNAGAGAFGSFAATEFEEWEQQVALLLLGAMKLSHLALNQWTAERPGVLATIGSLAADYPIPYMSGYNAAKAGLAAFIESLLLENDPAVVGVLELRLGDFDTAFNDSVRGRPCDVHQSSVWEAMCRHVREGPAPELVGRRLVTCLEQDRVGVVRIGGFFQAVLAPLFARLVSRGLSRAANRSYYNLRKHR